MLFWLTFTCLATQEIRANDQPHRTQLRRVATQDQNAPSLLHGEELPETRSRRSHSRSSQMAGLELLYEERQIARPAELVAVA